MRLSELERNILVAEKDYRTLEDKLNHVNLKMRFIKMKQGTRETQINPGCKNKLIKSSTYYRKLGELNKKTKNRAMYISKNLLPDLVNEHDTLIEDRKEVRDMMASALVAEKHMAAARLKILNIDLGRRIFAVKNQIAILMERPTAELTDEEHGEAIRLLTDIQ